MIVEADDLTEMLKQEEDSSQKVIDSYNNYDLKETASTVSLSPGLGSSKPSKPTNEVPLDTSTEDDSNSHFEFKDSTEEHGKYISNDDEYRENKADKKNVIAPTTITASKENEEEDGCIHGEFTGYSGGISEVYQEYHECAFSDADAMQYYEGYNDCTYDTSIEMY